MACSTALTLAIAPSKAEAFAIAMGAGPAQLVPPNHHVVQFKGSRIARALLALWGWSVTFHGLPQRRGVIIVYPHTSNWDFVVLMLAKWSIGLQVGFWGKDSLFKIPLFGVWLRWLGGIPVVRNASGGAVGQVVQAFAQHAEKNDLFWLGLSPEGTRKRTAGWRSGFYQVAVQAKVPLGLVRLDFAKREITATDFVTLSGDKAHDMQVIADVFQDTHGLNDEQASPIQLLDQ